MKETIRWDYSGPSTRGAVVELCGWSNKSGKATQTGKRIAACSWETLSPAARRVLENHGIEQ